MATKKYSLAIEAIDEAAVNFASQHSSYIFEIKNLNDGMLKQISFSCDKTKDRGILNCYIVNGQVSINIQGKNGPLKNLCNECWEYIVSNTSLPDEGNKCFKLKDVTHDDFDTFIAVLKDYDNIVISQVNSDNNKNLLAHYLLKGKYNAKVSVNYYNNGTLFVQGALTPFFIELVTETLQTISNVPNESIEEVFSIDSRAPHIFEDDLSNIFEKLDHIQGSVVETFINTSIRLANTAVPVPDYGCYTFGILKAIDALIVSRIIEDAGDFDDYGTYFHRVNGKYCFKDGVGLFDHSPKLKSVLERGYSFFHRNRHTTFHVDQPNIETSRVLSYDDAINIIKEAIVIINDICKNW